MSEKNDHLWGIILAGGEGRRLQPFIRMHYGSDRPKQYCALIGTRSMLQQTIVRAERLIPPCRLLTVVNRQHLAYAREELSDRPSGSIIVQPCNRETGPGILLPLLHIHHRDPEAKVAIFPSDHFIREEDRFTDAVEDAVACVTAHPSLLVLLGVAPDHPEAGYGWIETGKAIGWYRGKVAYQVKRFWEKPSVQRALALYVEGCLWNTLILISQLQLLLELFQRLAPEVFNLFQRIRGAFGISREGAAVEEVYAQLPTVNFSRAILEQSHYHLAVLHVQGVYWSDWGEAERIRLDLARFGMQPRSYAPTA
jgi:mannose-1-phosphate guanylyltransferase